MFILGSIGIEFADEQPEAETDDNGCRIIHYEGIID